MAKINPAGTHQLDSQQALLLLQALEKSAEFSGNRNRLSRNERYLFLNKYLGPAFGFVDNKMRIGERGTDWRNKVEKGAWHISFFNSFRTADLNKLLGALRSTQGELADSEGVSISYGNAYGNDGDPEFYIFLGAELLRPRKLKKDNN